MKKIIHCLAFVSLFTLAVSLAHADAHGSGGDKHDGAGHDGSGHDVSGQDDSMRGHSEDKMLKKMDSNGDGTLSRAEFDAFHLKHFDELDANKDGKITLEEMKTGHKGMSEKGMGKAKGFDEVDTNKDGALSRQETEKMPMLSKRFDEMDANHDGKVTREEMGAAMKKMHQSRGGKHGSE